MQRLIVKYRNEDSYRLEVFTVGDWIDLAVDEDVTLKAREFKLLNLGVAMELPEGYEAMVIPRSSTFKKYGLIQANSVGLIDETYNGNEDYWLFPAYATRDIEIKRGTRIAQFRILRHQPSLVIYEAEELGNKNRGGFGSTGTTAYKFDNAN